MAIFTAETAHRDIHRFDLCQLLIRFLNFPL